MYINLYGIDRTSQEGQAALIEIAKLAAQKNGAGTAEFIQNYGIDSTTSFGRQGLMDIATLIAKRDGDSVSEYIQRFGFDKATAEGQEVLVKIAQLAAQQNGSGTSKYIQNYGFDKNTAEGKKILLEVVKQAAQKNSPGTFDYIQNYGFDKSPESQRLLIDMAKQTARENGMTVCLSIQNCGIDNSSPEGKKAIIEIAVLAAQQDGEAVSKYIQNFGIDKQTLEGQAVLIEIAKAAAVNCGWAVSANIQNYGIDTSTVEGGRALFEIAKIAAQGRSTSRYIQNYGFKESPEGRKALIKIAKIAAQHDGAGISQAIKNFGFDASTPKGQKTLIKMAKLSARQNGKETAKNIQNYGINASTIEGQTALIEIASLCAENNDEMAIYIQNFGIDPKSTESQKALIEIAKIAAQNQGWRTSRYIDNFGIDKSTPEGRKALVEIAKLAAKNRGSTSDYIQNYGFDKSTPEGQATLIEIAKLAAQQSGSYTSLYINNYSIDTSTLEGQKAIIDILQLAAQNDGKGTSEHIKKYPLAFLNQDRLEDLYNFIYVCISKQLPEFSFNALSEHFAYFKDNCKSNVSSVNLDLFKGPFNKISKGEIKEAVQECEEILEKTFNFPKDNVEWLRNNLAKNEDIFIQKRFLIWFLVSVSLCSNHPRLWAAFKAQQDYIKEIAKQGPGLREELIKEFIQLYFNKNELCFEKLKHNFNGTVHLKLPTLVLSNFPPNNEEIYQKALSIMKKEREIFKDAKHNKLLLETLLAIKNSLLTSEQQSGIIKMLFSIPVNELLQGLRLVSDILAFKGEEYIGLIKDLKGLKNTLDELFQKKLGVKVDDFGDCYEKTIGQWRNKEALMTYAGKLQGLQEDKIKAISLFKQLMVMILQGSFKKDRYTMDQNQHLKEIARQHGTIFEKWQQEEQLESNEIMSIQPIYATPVKERVLKTLKQAIVEKHLGGEHQVALYPYVQGILEEGRTLKETLEMIQTEIQPLSGRKLNSEESVKRQSLLVQIKLLQLLDNPLELENKLKDLKGIIPSTFEFYRDIESSIKMLQTQEVKKKTNYRVYDTDDPNQFLLMGTEVLNSCQSVKGTPGLNVCLLGYFLDGKHRLLLVCDEQGKILARSVIRLLIDSQGQPVLFFERIYVADASPEYPGLLKKMAIKKALALGIPLVCSYNDFEKEKLEAYPHQIVAKEKPVSFEYVDALGGRKDGPYRINQVYKI